MKFHWIATDLQSRLSRPPVIVCSRRIDEVYTPVFAGCLIELSLPEARSTTSVTAPRVVVEK